MHRRLSRALTVLVIAIVGCTLGCTNGVNGLGRYDAIATQEAAHCPALLAAERVQHPPGVYQNHGILIDYDKLAPLPDPDKADTGYVDHVVRDPRLLEQVYADATRGNARASYSVCHIEIGARNLGRQAARYFTGLKCEYVTSCTIRFNELPISETTASGFRLRSIIGEAFEAEAQRRRLRHDLIGQALTLLVGARVASAIRPGIVAPKPFQVIQGPARGFGSISSFRRAMGSAGPGMEWHHIVEQTKGNIAKFGPKRIHNTSNVIRLDKRIHQEISASYSRKLPDLGITVRQWLSSQSFEAQRQYGLQVLRKYRVDL